MKTLKGTTRLFCTVLLAIILALISTGVNAQSDCPANGVYGKNVGRDFFVSVVAALNDVRQNDFAVEALMAWSPYENTKAFWNPLATTWQLSPVCFFNCITTNDAGQCIRGVQNYASQSEGVYATANTLNQTYYYAIRKMLNLNGFDREAVRNALGKWGTCQGARCDSLLNTWQTLYDRYQNGDDHPATPPDSDPDGVCGFEGYPLCEPIAPPSAPLDPTVPDSDACTAPDQGVKFYSEKGFRGAWASVTEDLPDFQSVQPFGVTAIKSICISPGVTVKLYTKTGFSGPSEEFSSSRDDLTWLSSGGRFRSIRIFRNQPGELPTSEPGADAPFPPPVDAPAPDDFPEAACNPPEYGVTLYSETGFRGASASITQDYSNLRSVPPFGAAAIKSICISPGIMVKLYTQIRFSGPSEEFSSSRDDLTWLSSGGRFRSIRIIVVQDDSPPPFQDATEPNPSPSVQERIIQLVKRQLAAQLGISIAEIELISIAPVTWPNPSLGCPEPGAIYPQVIVPGYRIVLLALGGYYAFHTDDYPADPQIVLCDEETADLPDDALPLPPIESPYPSDIEFDPSPTELQEAIRGAKQQLAAELRVPVSVIELVSIEPVIWNDGSVGCPLPPDKAALMVISPGYRIVLRVYGQDYELRGGVGWFVIDCNFDSEQSSQLSVETPELGFDDACYDAGSPSFQIGDWLIATAQDDLRVRSGPGHGYSVVQRLAPGAQIVVTAGPVCESGRWWWEVQTATGFIGWIVDNTSSGGASPYPSSTNEQHNDENEPQPRPQAPTTGGGCYSHDANRTYWNVGDVTPSGWTCLPGNMWERNGETRPGA